MDEVDAQGRAQSQSTSPSRSPAARYGMVVDLDRCDGCGACMVACAVENNVPPPTARSDERTGVNWMRVERIRDANGNTTGFVPVMCQHCDHETPCVSVCPQNAVERDPRTGLVAQIPVRCLGCRYCMTACPYHARSFNWWDPDWPGRLTEAFNPDVSTRTRGVVEKCSFCSHRYQAARAAQAAEAAAGENDTPPEYTPACVEACPAEAFTFGNLADPESAVAKAVAKGDCFRMLEAMGTDSKVYYRSSRAELRTRVASAPAVSAGRIQHG